jgi:hypothetical protein
VELELARDIGEEEVTYVDNIYKYYDRLAVENQAERARLKSKGN